MRGALAEAVEFPLSLPSGAFRGRVRARTLPRLVGRRWGRSQRCRRREICVPLKRS